MIQTFHYDSLAPEGTPLELLFFLSYFLIQGCLSTSDNGSLSSGSFLNSYTISTHLKSGRLTLVMRSAASGETESGIFKSTVRIRRYVAAIISSMVNAIQLRLTRMPIHIFEWWASDQKLVCQNTKSPEIDL